MKNGQIPEELSLVFHNLIEKRCLLKPFLATHAHGIFLNLCIKNGQIPEELSLVFHNLIEKRRLLKPFLATHAR
jgi:hypothetical protein